MKKSIHTTLIFLCFLVSFAHAQLQQGDWAPPFTLTDINGIEYRLYDYLSQGKPVIIDFSAAWCPPCWDQHQSEVLQTIYETHGPEGSDELMIFMIESDPRNTTDHLYGLTGPSMGNWVQGTPYPIIDLPDWSVGNAYRQFAYPTIYLICPDFRVVGNMWTTAWSVDYVLNQVATCGGATPPENDVIVHSYQRNEVDCYTANLFAKIINGGTTPLTEATIAVSRGGTEITTLEWTGNLGLGEEADISFEAIDLLPDENVFTLALMGNDEDESNNAINIPYFKAPNSVKDLIVYFGTDQFVEEHNTRWRIENENGEVVAESGALINNNYTETYVSLPNTGCYSFIITDDEGDGLIGDGFIVLSDIEDRIIYEEEIFGAEGQTIFLVQDVVGVQELTGLSKFSLFPNPTPGETLVSFELAESMPIQLNVVSLLGQVIEKMEIGQLPVGEHQYFLNTNNWPSGVYVVEIQSGAGQISKRMVKY